MTETIVVCAIVGAVLFVAGRSFYRTLTGKSGGCGCGKTCAASGHCGLSEAAKQERKKGTARAGE